MNKRQVYMDHSATTQVDEQVLEAMLPFFRTHFGNPNSPHEWGRVAKKAIDEGREKVASLINAEPAEIYFTGGGSEADNLAIKGAIFAKRDKGNHIVTSAIEHHAILHTFEWLRKQGVETTILPVDSLGRVDPDDVKRSLRKETVLVSIMYANNEVGTIEPIEEIASICKQQGVLFHTDAVQAGGHIPIDLKKLPVDMLTLAAHKMYGPKGIGALFVRKGVRIDPLIHGGGQEFGMRAGTENTAGIVGFGEAAFRARKRLERGEIEKEKGLRDRLIGGVLTSIPDSILTGDPTNRLPFHASFCIQYIEGESMLLLLDQAGIAASSGSACTSGSLEPSHVLLAMGLPHEIAHGSLRLTLGKDTTRDDVDYLLEVLPRVVTKLRALSPFGKSRNKEG